MTIWGSYDGIGLSHNAAVANGKGAFSISNVPGLTYNIGVKGIATGPSVNMEVSASTGVSVGQSGNYTATVNTNGLPAGVYDVYQDNVLIAIVYLGVQAPALPTPVPIPTVPAKVNSTAQPVSGTSNSGSISTEDLVAVLATLGICCTGAYLLVLRKK
jgi:hypothetical protein